MKEQVFAWFPASTEVLKTRNKDIDTYTKECLYRFDKSRFSNKISDKLTTANETETATKHELTQTTKADGVMKTFRPATSMHPHPPPATLGFRSRSATPGTKDRWQSPGVENASQVLKFKEWQSRLAETKTSTLTPTGHSLEPSLQANPPVESTPGRSRVQSACIQRPPVPVVKRTIKSALPLATTSVVNDRSDDQRVRVGPEVGPLKSRQLVSRPQAPTPLRWMEEETDQVEEEEEPTDYDQQLKTFGWKMEIPGDPFRIKRSCIHRRLPTTLVVPVQSNHQRSNGCQTQSGETFFYNTIPRNPMSFTIHPDWASEVFQARRQELEAKQERSSTAEKSASVGLRKDRHRYVRYADFSFVY